MAKKTKVSIRANAIKDVLNKFSASSGFLAAPTLYPAKSTPVPIAAPAKVTEISPSAINFDAVIANKITPSFALIYVCKFYILKI